MRFNKPKMEDDRRDEAEKAAAARQIARFSRTPSSW
jgi:hypothetical protein